MLDSRSEIRTRNLLLLLLLPECSLRPGLALEKGSKPIASAVQSGPLRDAK